MAVRRIGAYVMSEEPFASGGMATLHFARVAPAAGGFSRVVAAKRVRADLLGADPTLAPLLVREARAASALRHNNVVSVIDLVDAHGELFLVMDYIDGPSLASLLEKRGRINAVPLAVASAIVGAVFRALDCLHHVTRKGRARDLVHRDVSPANVLVGADGSVKLTDLGIAVENDRTRLTRTGEVRGKLGYVAPELLEGRAASARSDLYSAGVLAWELACGRRLFDAAPGPELLEQIAIGTIDRVRVHRPEAPAAFEALVAACLSTEPARRPDSALAAARALEAALPAATPSAVASWVETALGAQLRERAALLAAFELEADGAVGSAPVSARVPRSRPANALARPAIALASAAVALASIGLTVFPRARASARPSEYEEHVGAAVPSASAASSSAIVGPAPSEPAKLAEPARRPTARPRPRRATEDCDTNFDLDAHGHKVYKIKCL